MQTEKEQKENKQFNNESKPDNKDQINIEEFFTVQLVINLI